MSKPKKSKENLVGDGKSVKTTVQMESFCNEILDQIFKNFNAAQLRIASLVCSRWNEIIGSTPEVMDKFKLVLEHFEQPTGKLRFNEHCHSTRKHQNVRIVNLSIESAVLYLANVNISLVKSFHMKTKDVYSGMLSDLLAKMPQLVDLELNFSNFILPEGIAIQPVDLPKLEKLVIDAPHPKIYKLFTAKNLTRLCHFSNRHFAKVNYSWGAFGEISFEDLINLLNNCKHIKIMELGVKIILNLFHASNLSDSEFRLKTFRWDVDYPIYFNLLRNPRVFENLGAFMITQMCSLDHLEMYTRAPYVKPHACFLHPNENFPEGIYEVIFKQLRLKSLQIKGSTFPTRREFPEDLGVLPSLSKLTIIGKFGTGSRQVLRSVLYKCAQVVDLTLTETPASVLSDIVRALPLLYRLTIDEVRAAYEDHAFINAVYIKVRKISDINHWLSLIRRCPRIHILAIEELKESDLTDDAITELLRQRNLKFLELAGQQSAIESIKRNEAIAQTLTVTEMTNFTWNEKPNHHGIFYYP